MGTQPLPSRSPFLMPDGTVNPHWLDALNALVNSINTGSVPTDLTIGSRLISYNGVASAGWGLWQPVAYQRRIGEIAALPSLATYTLGGADGSFIINANVNVTTSTTHNFTTRCNYVDETNTNRSVILGFAQLTGATWITAITDVTGAGPYHSASYPIRCKAGTAITLFTTGTFTTLVYNAEGSIVRTA